MFMAVQFAKEHFLIPALTPLVYNLGIILGGVVLYQKIGIMGFSWGALTGAFIGSFFIQYLGAHKIGMRYRFRIELRHPDLKRYTILTLPLILGLTMLFSTEVFSKYFGSYLPPGGISWIDFAMRILMVLVGFFGQAVGVASYPFLAKLAAEKRLDEMNRILSAGMRYLALMIPMSVLVWVLRSEIVRVLFQRGNFTGLDSQMTALALSGMLIGATAFAVQTLVNRGFYAVGNTLLPAIFNTLTTAVAIPLYWIGLKTMGILGIGLAISLAALIQVIVVYGVWNKSSRNQNSRTVYRFYGKMVALSLPLGLVLWAAHRLILLWIDVSTFAAGIGVIVILGMLFTVLMGLAARLFNINEIQSLTAKLKAKLFKPAA
jgi:putative peptidoglycan lipid II flippase